MSIFLNVTFLSTVHKLKQVISGATDLSIGDVSHVDLEEALRRIAASSAAYLRGPWP